MDSNSYLNIPRLIQRGIEKQIGRQKVVMLYGSRRTGKTIIIENIASKYGSDVLMLQGEDMQIIDILSQRTIANYQQLLKGKKIIIIDEAQAVPNIGKVLKLMIDNIKNITIIATGSSSFDLASTTGEPLTGRNVVFYLYPIAQAELAMIEDHLTTQRNLEERLIYGSYPELWHYDDNDERQAYLKQLVNSYLLKDILMYDTIKGADVLFKLMQLLAWQVGSEASMVELGNSLQINRATVERYLDLLTKVFVIFPLGGYSGNLRKEVTKSKKWYFYDNGIRNALINNFNPLNSRNDKGQLWEQYVLSERIKFNSYRGYKPQYFYWRTYDQQEIDMLELNGEKLQGIECKFQKQRDKVPVAFAKGYPDAQYDIIDRRNYLGWISQ
jgi:uncharacterized protein